MSDVLRIIDANANRAREALRVMEDVARFIISSAPQAETIKKLRHELTESLSQLDCTLYWRNTPDDVGTDIKTDRELVRNNTFDVVAAACKRLTEALRTIEEYSKTLQTDMPALPRKIELIRYHAYDAEQSLLRCLATGSPRQYRLCVLVTESLCIHHGWLDVAQAAIRGGADCIQLREKELDDQKLLDRAGSLVECCHQEGVTAIINDRPDIAILAGADGVHLGQADLPIGQVRKLAGRRLIIGISTCNLEQAKQAHLDGADYCGVGPMFHTTTKLKNAIAGKAYLKQYLQWNKLPHLAIGGISPDNIDALIDCHPQGIAISACICRSERPEEVTHQLVKRLTNT